jgi:hypothetical protein
MWQAFLLGLGRPARPPLDAVQPMKFGTFSPMEVVCGYLSLVNLARMHVTGRVVGGLPLLTLWRGR